MLHLLQVQAKLSQQTQVFATQCANEGSKGVAKGSFREITVKLPEEFDLTLAKTSDCCLAKQHLGLS